ncbi:MAG: hypothetical protein ACJA1F_001936 [Paracoccaceae bacterium]|jgi:hypothetical protein
MTCMPERTVKSPSNIAGSHEDRRSTLDFDAQPLDAAARAG